MGRSSAAFDKFLPSPGWICRKAAGGFSVSIHNSSREQSTSRKSKGQGLNVSWKKKSVLEFDMKIVGFHEEASDWLKKGAFVLITEGIGHTTNVWCPQAESQEIK